MRGLINKKGSAHFEMIFAFVFFVGFTLFLFVVLKPQDTSTLSGSVIEALHDSFEDEIHTNLSTMFLKADDFTTRGGGKDCFKIELPNRIFIYAINDGSHVVDLKDVNTNSDLYASGDSGSLKVEKNDEENFRVFISPEFNDISMGICDNLTDYELGNVIERKVASYKALISMNDRYHNGEYEGLRDDLKIPEVFDFAIVPESEYLKSSISMEPNDGVPTSVEVQARDYIIELLNKEGELTNERFTLKVW